MKHKPYPKYKPSGIDWIGDIPEGWKVERLANIGIFSSSGIDKKINEDEPLVSMVNYTDIYGNEARVLRQDREYMVVSCPEAKRLIHQVEYGDLMFTPSSETIEDIGLSAVVDEDLPNTVFSYHVVRFVFQKNVSHEFKKYLCNNYFVLNQFSRLANGTTRQILGRFDFRSTLVVVPPIEEQQQIANYLDEKTARIDDLIQRKGEMLKLLKEKRAAIINQAVTKGLDLNAQMKPSGIDWIGNIPKHWETVCLRRVLKFWRYGISETLSSSGKYGILRMGDIVEGEICFDKLGYVDEVADELILNKYDLVFNRTNSLAQVGKVGLFRGEAKDNISLASYLVKLVVKNKHDPVYVWYTLNSSQILEFVRAMALPAIGQANLNPERYSYVKIPIPTFDEQRKIAEYLNHNTAEIDGLINKIESAIAKLREYRSSLITAAVTGKIDVRENVR